MAIYFRKGLHILIAIGLGWQATAFGATTAGFESNISPADQGWSASDATKLHLTQETAVSGNQSLKIEAAPGGVEVRYAGTEVPSAGIRFIDLSLKPVGSRASEAMTSLNAWGAELAFVAKADGTLQVAALHGTKDSPKVQFVETSARVGADGQAEQWVRLTVRQDLEAKRWDLFVDGKLAAVDLELSPADSLVLFGDAAAPVYLDDLQIGAQNPLFADADGDAMPDDYEEAQGLNPAVNDRAQDINGNGTSNIGEFAAGSAPQVLPALASVIKPPRVAKVTSEDPAKILFQQFTSAFVNDFNGQGVELAVMDADGTDITVLAGEDFQHYGYAALSADGTRVAFVADTTEDPTPALYVMNAEPYDSVTNPAVRMRGNVSAFSRICWSPDGRRIAFADTFTSQVYVLEAVNGSGDVTPESGPNPSVQITTVNGESKDPAWSPDGKYLAYSNGSIIYAFRVVDTSNTLTPESIPSNTPKNLTAFNPSTQNHADFPAWSPDGTQLAFQITTQSPQRQTDIAVLTVRDPGPDGALIERNGTTDPRVSLPGLTPSFSPYGYREPSWSPDGSRVIFESVEPPAGGPNDIHNLASLKPEPVEPSVNPFTFLTTADANGIPGGRRALFQPSSDAPAPAEDLLPVPDFTLDSDIASIQPYSAVNSWTFKARLVQPLPSGTTVRVQSSTTPSDEGSWTDVPGGGMSNGGGTAQTWVATTSQVPGLDDLHFRVIAAASGAIDKVSVVRGPYDIEPRPLVAPATEFTVLPGGKKGTIGKQGTSFKFTARQEGDRTLQGLELRVQFSLTPDDESSWQDLPEFDLGRSTKTSLTWVLETLRIPSGTVYFRVLTSAPGHTDGIGPVSGPYTIAAAPILDFHLRAESDSDSTGKSTHVGETITYHLTIHNYGDAALQEARVKMDVPAMTKLEGATHRDNPPGYFEQKAAKLTYNLGTIGAGGMVTEAVLCEVTDAADSGDVITAKVASIKGLNSLSVVANQPKTTVLGPLSLTLDKDKNIALPGDIVRYTLTVKNSNSFAINNVRVTDILPIGTALHSVSLRDSNTGDFDGDPLSEPDGTTNPAITPYDPDGGLRTLTWTFPTLAPGEEHTMEFDARIFWDLAADEIVNGVHMTREIRNTDYNVRAVPSTGKKEIVGYPSAPPPARTLLSGEAVSPPQLSLTKQSMGADAQDHMVYTGFGDCTTVVPGGTYTYTLSYANKAGAASGEHVTIHDEIPVGVEFSGGFERDGVAITDFSGFLFFNESGHVVPAGGEPITNDNGNGVLDKNEKYTDTNGNKKFDGVASIRSLDIDLGVVAGGEDGDFSYDVKVGSKTGDGTQITSRGGGLVADNTKSTKTKKALRGYLVRSRNMGQPSNGAPEFLTVLVSQPVAIAQTRIEEYPQPMAGVPVPLQDEFLPGQEVRYIIRYSVTGGALVQLRDHQLNLTVARGYTITGISFLDANDAVRAANTSGGASIGESLPDLNATPVTDKAGQRLLTVGLGGLPGIPNDPFFGKTGAIEVRLTVPNPLPKDEKKKPGLVNKEGQALQPVYLSAQHTGGYVTPAPTARAREPKAPKPSILGLVTLDSAYLLASSGLVTPRTGSLFIGVGAPIQVQRGDLVTFTVFYGNATRGSDTAGNCEVGVQIPYGTIFRGATKVVNFQPAGRNDRTEEPRLAPSAQKPTSIYWDVLDFHEHAAGAVQFTVEVPQNFVGNTITIDSAYITARDGGGKHVGAGASPIKPVSVHVRDNGLLAAIGEAIGGFFSSIGSVLTGPARTAMQAHEEALSQPNARTYALGGTQYVQLTNGANVIQLFGNRVLVFGQPRAVGALAQDIAASDGQGCVVAVGHESASTILINNVLGSHPGNYRPAEILVSLRSPGASIVAGGGGNIVAAGGGNLIGADGASLIGNDGAGVVGTVTPNASGIVAAGGGNIVAGGGGNLIGNDGAGVILIATGAGGIVAAGGGNYSDLSGVHLASKLIGQDGAAIVAAGGGNIVAAGGGNVVSRGGVSLLSSNMVDIMANKPAGIVAGGGGNLLAQDAAKGMAARIVAGGGGNVISNDGAGLIPGVFGK